MSTLTYILLFTFIGSIGSLIGGFALLANKKIALKISHYLAPYAAGTFIGAAFFDLLPEALHESKGEVDVFLWVVVGIVIFFLVERFIHGFHEHGGHHEHDPESKTTVPLIVIGDTVHNFIDGVVIAATFLISIPLGIVTTLAVFAHEIPQEIGDFGLLLHKGVSRKMIILINILSASVAFIGAMLGYSLGNLLEGILPIFLGLTAGFFIYIATSDLIPEIQYQKKRNVALLQCLILIAGILTIRLSTILFSHA